MWVDEIEGRETSGLLMRRLDLWIASQGTCWAFSLTLGLRLLGSGHGLYAHIDRVHVGECI